MKSNKLLILPIALIALLGLLAVPIIVNAQSANASADTWSFGPLPVGANVYNVTNNVTNSVSPNESQLYLDKYELLTHKSSGNTKTNNIQPLSTSQYNGLITICHNYCGGPGNTFLGYTAANDIVTTIDNNYLETAKALEGTSDTIEEAQYYWENDNALYYYTNIGESSFNSNPTSCDYLAFSDGSGNTQWVPASTISSTSPHIGLYLSDDYIESCYSNNQPMYGAFNGFTPNWYTGATVKLTFNQANSVVDQFWKNYITYGTGGGSPQSALNSACSSNGEQATDYHVTYNHIW